MKKATTVILALALSVMLSGCLQVHRPVVPAHILDDADHPWVVTKGEVEGDRDFAPKAVETEYRFDPEDDSGAYPGVLVLVGLRTLNRIPEDQLIDHARDILEDVMDDMGVEGETVTEETGSRVIKSGATTQWLTMQGEASSDSFLFSQDQEIRVLAEAWFDDPSNMHVVAIAIAQTGGTDFFGQPRTNLAVWNELVGDEDGSIQGITHTEGFIDHAGTED